MPLRGIACVTVGEGLGFGFVGGSKLRGCIGGFGVPRTRIVAYVGVLIALSNCFDATAQEGLQSQQSSWIAFGSMLVGFVVETSWVALRNLSHVTIIGKPYYFLYTYMVVSQNKGNPT